MLDGGDLRRRAMPPPVAHYQSVGPVAARTLTPPWTYAYRPFFRPTLPRLGPPARL